MELGFATLDGDGESAPAWAQRRGGREGGQPTEASPSLGGALSGWLDAAGRGGDRLGAHVSHRGACPKGRHVCASDTRNGRRAENVAETLSTLSTGDCDSEFYVSTCLGCAMPRQPAQRCSHVRAGVSRRDEHVNGRTEGRGLVLSLGARLGSGRAELSLLG